MRIEKSYYQSHIIFWLVDCTGLV